MTAITVIWLEVRPSKHGKCVFWEGLIKTFMRLWFICPHFWRFFKSSTQRTALRYRNRGSEWKTDRQTDKDRARWTDTGKQRKEENTSGLQGRRESLSAGCFDFILPLSAADGEMVRVGDAKELSDEWTSVHGPPASENAPITTQLLLHTKLNGPNGAQLMVFVPNNTRVRGFALNG